MTINFSHYAGVVTLWVMYWLKRVKEKIQVNGLVRQKDSGDNELQKTKVKEEMERVEESTVN